MYNDKVLVCKQEVITSIPGSIIPVDLCQSNEPVINFTTGDMRYKFEVFTKNKMNALYLNEITRT